MYFTDGLGGLKIMSIYHLQGFSKMQFLCIYTRNMDTTGKLLEISNRHTQLESDLSRPYFTYKFYSTSFLVTPTWTTNLWQYMSVCHAQLHEYDAWVYTPPRQHDFFLMDIVLRSNIPQGHKEIFNRVRINLRLLTASDIVVCNHSNKLLPHLLDGVSLRSSKFHWPQVQQLPPHWIQIFKTTLITVIRAQLESTPLGHWISDGHQK